MSEIDSASPLAGFPEYRLVRPLGRGAMGEVYLAHDPLLDRPVAVKFIAQLDPDPHARERFFIEARAVARLTHPNVVSVYRVGEWQGRPFLISEFVHGESLDRLKKPLPSAEALRLGVGLARGLGAAHRRGVLHRDIKPANAILGEDGEVKLLDFGLAKILDGSGEGGVVITAPSAPLGQGPEAAAWGQALQTDATLSFHDTGPGASPSGGGLGPAPSLRPPFPPGSQVSGLRLDATAPGSILGSPLYMAPEVWAGEPATRRSDVYSLGVVLYELLAGKAPHHGVPFLVLSRLVRESDVPRLLGAAPSVDPRLAAIIDRCVARRPEARFESGDALREALEALELQLRGPAAPAPLASLPEGNPYRGLATFEEEHRALFFGRGREVRAVLDRLREAPFVLVAGDSGVGKSSLCRAGVLPQLAGAVSRLVPGRRPAAAFAAAIAPLLGGEEPEEPLADPAGLGRRLRQLHPEGVTLFIDQMEELITLSEPAEAAALGEGLDLLLSVTPGLRLLGTVRGDFIARLAALPGLGRDVPRALFLLGPLSEEGLTEAIVGPAQALGYSFESPALVGTLVASAGAEEGGLPLLQFALAELWEARDAERRIIPAAALHAMGGVGGALARHADGVLGRLLPAQREAARRLLGQLITAEGTRARRTERELCGEPESGDDPDARSALSALVAGRLLVVRSAGDDGAGSVYELAHEALLHAWGTLKGWLLGDLERRLARQRLEHAAAEWERLGRLPELLFGERQLAEAEALGREALPPREAAFLGAARAARRRRRLLRGGLLAAGPLSLGLIYGAVRLEERRVTAAQVRTHMREAQAALAAAKGSAATAEARAREAFSLFDARARDGGEAAWERVKEAQREAQRAFERASRALETALMLDSGRKDVRELLAEVLYDRLLLAERLPGSQAEEELRARLTLYDDGGRLQARLAAPATLRLRMSPPDAAVAIGRYELGEDGARRLVEDGAPGQARGGEALRLQPGSYLLILSAPGRPPLRYPIALSRGESRELKLYLPTAAEVPAGFVYVPPGRALFGSAADDSLRRGFFDTVPLHAVESGAYLIARTETTFADWLTYLKALPEGERARRWPRAAEAGMHGSLALKALPDGRLQLTLQPTSQALTAVEGDPLRYPGRGRGAAQDWRRAPVLGVSWEDAQAYASWLDSTGSLPGARLCSEHEWERAARGADDRLYPHGDRLLPDEANFDRTYGKQPLGFGPDEVGAHPASRSPFGVDDLTGNAWEWVTSSVSGRESVVRGGSYYHTDRTCALTNRQETEPSVRNPMVGLRLCATWRGPAE